MRSGSDAWASSMASISCPRQENSPMPRRLIVASALPNSRCPASTPYYDTYNGGTFPKTDYSYSIDQLQAAFPACTTVAVVCAWFGNSDNLTIANCQIYPATTYVNNGSIINPATGLPWPVISPSAFQKW